VFAVQMRSAILRSNNKKLRAIGIRTRVLQLLVMHSIGKLA
jgi:hypothetical protein